MLLMVAWLSAVVQRPLPAGDQRDTIGAAVTWTVAAPAPSIRSGTHTPPHTAHASFDRVRAIRLPDPQRVERVRIDAARPIAVDAHRVSPYDATAPPLTSRSI